MAGTMNPEIKTWLIAQGIAFFVIISFAIAVKITIESRMNKTISQWGYFIPIVLGFAMAVTLQYFILFVWEIK